MSGYERGRVLVIEDDRRTADFVCQGLAEAEFEVEVALNGIDGFKVARQGAHDVLVLDLMLPGMDGLALLKKLRDRGVNTPVLILSAKRSVDDRVLGLQTGGDDYLVKPFVFAELLARIESLLRRAQGNHEPVRLRVADLWLDPLSRRVYRGGKEIELQPYEFSLLEYLMRNKDQIVTRKQILRHVWGYSFNPSTNIVEVHICRLREKIELPGRPKLLRTVRGTGYILVEDEELLD